jgi:hypothetical protein
MFSRCYSTSKPFYIKPSAMFILVIQEISIIFLFIPICCCYLLLLLLLFIGIFCVNKAYTWL